MTIPIPSSIPALVLAGFLIWLVVVGRAHGG
jgi:hypothetical protein